MERQNGTAMWFQRLFQKLKLCFLSETEETLSDSFPTNFPPELLEYILEHITDHNTLLRCRLVCSKWKGSADNLLEKRRLSELSSWNPNLDIRSQHLIPSVWAVWVLKTCPNRFVFYQDTKLVFPSMLKKSHLKENPFPQKSLAIVGFRYGHLDEQQRCTMELMELVQKFGNFLTSLILHDVDFGLNNLNSILGTMLSLKAISFSGVSICDDVQKTDVTIAPKFTHLQLINSGLKLSYFLPFFAIKWLA